MNACLGAVDKVNSYSVAVAVIHLNNIIRTGSESEVDQGVRGCCCWVTDKGLLLEHVKVDRKAIKGVVLKS
uniref:Uncharacterized protein n=1 Tax=uncultured marine virus TaxID=186617 RepID=A0A0F7L9R3_9VIRU|nr:hypothetical protein [uncultured marine virus]